MEDYIYAPVPYLMGLDSVSITDDDFIIVNLDKSQVQIPFTIPSLPSPCSFHLLKDLESIINNVQSNTANDPNAWNQACLQTQYAVFNFMVEVFHKLPPLIHRENVEVAFAN